jgi:triosephosphate isomerase
MRRKLAAGNWKMNGTGASLAEIDALVAAHPTPIVDILICPPATLVAKMVWKKGDHPMAVGGQDCHANASGAHTGDISAAMLLDAGASHVIVGHSERRTDHGETDALVHAKTEAAHAAGLIGIVCVGETLAEREAGQTIAVVSAQLAGSLPTGTSAANTVVAYEPVWAIGTGKIPTLDEIAEVHANVRAVLVERFGDQGQGIRILYGGSVKPSNADEIFAVADVDGALVGGASLKASDFGGIIDALQRA